MNQLAHIERDGPVAVAVAVAVAPGPRALLLEIITKLIHGPRRWVQSAT